MSVSSLGDVKLGETGEEETLLIKILDLLTFRGSKEAKGDNRGYGFRVFSEIRKFGGER